MLISKTTFLEFQICPKNTWLKLHKPELLAQFNPSEFELGLMEQGNEVEGFARNLFPGGVLVVATGDDACAETQRLMASRAPAIFQATFVVDGFIAKCDVLVPGAEGGTWEIFEIKGTNSKKEGGEDRDHISDVAFQSSVLGRVGVKVGRMFIVHLNKEYVRQGPLDVEAMFIKSDSTDQVQEKRAKIDEEMAAAKEFLNRADEPGGGCECHYNGRSRHCTTFEYSHPEIPEYSVHDIVRIGQSKAKLLYLVDGHFYSIDDVPEELELGEAQANQVRASKSSKAIIDADAIRAALAEYRYPLYFFDYETFAPAIPAFNGYSPYRRIPFQFSLHALKEPGGELEHVEYLHEEATDPTERVAELMSMHIDPAGTVLVWRDTFELGVNKEIGERRQEFASVMERINAQVRDLEDIFVDQHYVHPGFRGKTSIKSVLPVMCPELSYRDLAIQEGATASNEWWRMIGPGTSPSMKAAIAADLRAYCKRDTYAMYAIWRKLGELAA